MFITIEANAYETDHVRVEESDAIESALVVTIKSPDPDTAPLFFECSRIEARELIIALVALL
jgi:hypothetical protein